MVGEAGQIDHSGTGEDAACEHNEIGCVHGTDTALLVTGARTDEAPDKLPGMGQAGGSGRSAVDEPEESSYSTVIDNDSRRDMPTEQSLFWWWSDALKQYASGRIVVIAHDAEEARQKARALVDAHLREHHEWMFILDDDDEALNEWKKKFAADIAKEPSIGEDVLFINGSE